MPMGLALGLIVIAVVLLVLGLVISAIKWLLIIAAVVFVVGLIRGAMARKQIN